MTNEVKINGIDGIDTSNPESLLDNAIASIKNNNISEESNEIQENEFTQNEKENQQTEINKDEVKERETLKLPQKDKFVKTEDPEVQQRISELYKKQKTAEETNALLRDELLRITENFEVKENQLQTQLQQIQGRFNEQDENQVLSQLRNQYKEAIENFEYDKALQINEKILDFKTEQKLNSLINKIPATKQEQNIKPKAPVKQDFYSDPQDIADANKLTSEKDENGEIKRPWLQQGHPEFENVVDMVAAVANKYIRKNQRPSLSIVMNEVDKYMGLGQNKNNSQNTLRHAPVLSSNATLNAGSDNQANKLSDLERSYASKLGVSEKDYARMRKLSSSGPISLDNFK